MCVERTASIPSERMALAMVCVIFIASLVGCAGDIPAEARHDPNMGFQRFTKLIELGAEHLECSEQELAYGYMGFRLHALSGCGRSVEFMLNCLGSLCQWTLPPIEQASFDLDCAAENLQFVPIRELKVGLIGCGRRASYGWVCQDLQNCAWYKDGIDGARSEAGRAAVISLWLRAKEAEKEKQRMRDRAFADGFKANINQSTAQSGLANAAAAQ